MFGMPPSATSFHQLPAGRPSSTFTICDGVSWWKTIPGKWPWQTAACALLPAHSSLILRSQLVPISFYSCCPGICWDTQYCTAATGLLRPEVGSRVQELQDLCNPDRTRRTNIKTEKELKNQKTELKRTMNKTKMNQKVPLRTTWQICTFPT